MSVTPFATNVLSQIMPNTGQEAGGDVVTLTGIGFTGATAVQFGTNNGTNLTVVSDTSITCATPAGTGTVDVTVVTPNGNATLAGGFGYLSLLILAVVMPNTGLPAGGDTVTLTGAHLTGATRVTFGGTAATNLTVVSDTSITCVVPAGTGTVDVTVETPNGNSTLVGGFGYLSVGPAPNCILCKYFGPLPATQPLVPGQRRVTVTVQSGYCRHYPPTIASGPGNSSGWPVCGAGDWCGEFVYQKATTVTN